jgi:CheY-like chemotaxis protein
MNPVRPALLLVDDEPLNLDIMCEYLGDAEYELVCAENGLIAWNILESDPCFFSAILLDRMMPVMDGMQLLARLREHPLLKNVPVIMQSARAEKEDIREGLEAGARYYLTKPYSEELLISVVRSAVNDYIKQNPPS